MKTSNNQELQVIPLWAKLVLIAAMVMGSDPISEPVINRCYSAHIGAHTWELLYE